MGRNKKNTIQKSVNMHPRLVSEVRGYAKKRTDEEIIIDEKTESEKIINSKKE